MPSNVEIKARVEDLDALRAGVEGLSDGPAEVIDQEDVFFRVPTGRLKLRILTNGTGELIHYHREDTHGPKQSRYSLAHTGDPATLREILASIVGIIGVVKKRRLLFLIGQTRVHLDRVEGLGEFMELEVVLHDGQSAAEGVQIAEGLMSCLGITPDQLVARAYIDLLTERA